MPADTAVDLENFSKLVVPIRQERGLFQKEYSHPTLRGRSWPSLDSRGYLPDMVNTVRGPVPGELLGPALMHEHVFVVDAEYAWNYYSADEVEGHIAAAAAQLNAAHAAGVRTIVDCTVLGVGRIVPWLQDVTVVPTRVVPALREAGSARPTWSRCWYATR
jgi:hypothetical protein